ncbi:uncharacterized protein [Chelonus insularis]|uniref:uncharacterized protein n=1 Tax=Chelonus insularis TaxID=460826 RepID=UPI00158F2E60|nr:uncharacterized protein LOC118068329 [Chelonus insularis]
MTQSSRKRLRSMEEESSEFTPLSKRINNLHLNGWSGLRDSTNNSVEFEWNDKNCPSSNNSEPSPGSSSSEGYNHSQKDFVHEYRPELGINDNPYYYENNKLLYTLYMERMQRRTTFNHL